MPAGILHGDGAPAGLAQRGAEPGDPFPHAGAHGQVGRVGAGSADPGQVAAEHVAQHRMAGLFWVAEVGDGHRRGRRAHRGDPPGHRERAQVRQAGRQVDRRVGGAGPCGCGGSRGHPVHPDPGARTGLAVEVALGGNLGVDRLDLYYAHIDDRDTPLEETVGAFAGLAESGKAGLLGSSNTATWRIERARTLAAGRPAYSCVQQEGSYLLPRPDRGHVSLVTEELRDYVAAEGLTLFAYSPLVAGGYARRDRPMPRIYDHPTNEMRLAVLDKAAADTGATVNQVVLAWMLAASSPPVIPIPGASSVAQLDEIIAATELVLDQATLERLNRTF